MSVNARNFSGGAATDIISSNATITPPTQVTYGVFINITGAGVDGTSRRFISWDAVDVLSVSTGALSFSSNWSVTGGAWHITIPSTDTFHAIVLTYDGSATTNNPTILVDNVSQSVTTDTTPSGSILLSAANFRIGNRNDQVRCFPGAISAVAVWNTILGSTDITNYSNGTPACSISPGSLLAYWPLDNGDSPEPETVSSNVGNVTGTTVVSGPSAITNARCRGLFPFLQQMIVNGLPDYAGSRMG